MKSHCEHRPYHCTTCRAAGAWQITGLAVPEGSRVHLDGQVCGGREQAVAAERQAQHGPVVPGQPLLFARDDLCCAVQPERARRAVRAPGPAVQLPAPRTPFPRSPRVCAAHKTCHALACGALCACPPGHTRRQGSLLRPHRALCRSAAGSTSGRRPGPRPWQPPGSAQPPRGAPAAHTAQVTLSAGEA